nr:lysophospholipid acyltransferase family protein [Aeromicrobium senzhongii]
MHAVPEDDGPGQQEPPREATADLDPEDVAAAFAEGARRLLGTDWQATMTDIAVSLRRRLSGDYSVDEFGMDPEVVDLLSHLVEPLAESWFRLQVRGIENIPADGGALLVANHSGTVPVDGLITGYAVRKYAGRPIRPLGADLVFRLPYVGQIARKMGATLACAEDAERLLTSGELAAVWPEGFKGVGKPFSERYKLQRFGRGGFVSSAMRAQVPIIPVSIVGAEEIYPLIGNIPSLARLLGVPYIPITPFFPLLGPLGLVPLPSKWIIEFGEPIRTDAYPPESADDPMLLFNVTDQVRETIQQTLYNLLVERGNPFV